MGELKEAAQQLGDALNVVEAECQVILDTLKEFDGYVASYVIDKLFDRLKHIDYWLKSETKRLYAQHQGNGYVCVFLSKAEGTQLFWVKGKEIVANKSWFASSGSTVISPEEAIAIIKYLTSGLGQGYWLQVLTWLSRYGRSFG